MPGVPITSSFDVNVLRVDIANMYYDEIKEDNTYTGLVDMKDKSYSPIPDAVISHEIYGLGPMQSRGETEAFAYDAPGPAGTKTSVYESFALAVKFTERLILMQRFDIIGKVVADLRSAYHLRRNLNVAAFYDDFFTGTLFTGPDGLAMGSASHTTYGAGAARANILETPAPFGYQGVQDLVTLMRSQRSNRGSRKPAINGNESLDVILPIRMEFEADRLFDVAAQLEPGNDSNTINVLKKFKWNVKLNTHATSTTNWFLANTSEKGFKLVDYQPLTPDTNPDPLGTKGVQHDIRAMWAEHPEKWEFIYGSNG